MAEEFDIENTLARSRRRWGCASLWWSGAISQVSQLARLIVGVEDNVMIGKKKLINWYCVDQSQCQVTDSWLVEFDDNLVNLIQIFFILVYSWRVVIANVIVGYDGNSWSRDCCFLQGAANHFCDQISHYYLISTFTLRSFWICCNSEGQWSWMCRCCKRGEKDEKEIVSQHIGAIASKDDHSLLISSYHEVFWRLDCLMLQTLSTPVLLAATPITK